MVTLGDLRWDGRHMRLYRYLGIEHVENAGYLIGI